MLSILLPTTADLVSIAPAMVTTLCGAAVTAVCLAVCMIRDPRR